MVMWNGEFLAAVTRMRIMVFSSYVRPKRRMSVAATTARRRRCGIVVLLHDVSMMMRLDDVHLRRRKGLWMRSMVIGVLATRQLVMAAAGVRCEIGGAQSAPMSIVVERRGPTTPSGASPIVGSVGPGRCASASVRVTIVGVCQLAQIVCVVHWPIGVMIVAAKVGM